MRQVTAAVIVEDGRILLARRGPHEKLAGLWELPGGKIDPGETPQQCLERELMEELSMTAEAGPLLARTVYTYDHGEFEMLALQTKRRSAYILTVHDEAGWFSDSDLESLPIAPADLELLDALRRLALI